MNGTKLFVDTNILIYFLNKDSGVYSAIEDKTIYISFISELELLSFRHYTNAEKKSVNDLLSDCIIIDISNEIKILAVEHRIKNKLKLPDAIIAATAQHLSVPLFTADIDFRRIKEIDVILFEKL